LKPGGLWLNTDFRLTGKWWQKVMLRSMFLFFRALCEIEANNLPDIWNTFERYHYQEIEKASFFGDFILSVAYRKS
jgi:hypothetical protein